MATANQVWPIGTDCKVVLSGLKDDAGAYVNDATVVGNLVGLNDAAVTNGSAISFTYIPASNGQYEAVIPYNAGTLSGLDYTFVIVATKGAKRATLKMTRPAQYIEI